MKCADIGIALDGDADRVIIVDETGSVVDGDQLIFWLPNHGRSKQTLLTALLRPLCQI